MNPFRNLNDARPVPSRLQRIARLAALSLASVTPAAPETILCDADARTSLELVLYGVDLALVRETRRLDLPTGTHDVEFADVARGIDPTSVLLNASSGEEFRVLEQRFAGDLIEPDRLLELSVGREVELVTRGDAGEQRTTATLLTPRGPVYDVDGKVWIRHPGEIVLPSMPEGLRRRPALLWRLSAKRGGPRTVETAYLTGGLGWDATYAARLDEAAGTLALQGWVTLHNRSGVDFEAASIRLVAGDVGRAPRPETRMLQAAPMAEAADVGGGFSQEAAFEYHMYRLERTLDLPERDSIQILLREERSVPFRRFLTFRGAPYSVRGPMRETRPMHAEIEVELENPGAPLPAGTFRAYRHDGEMLLFLGEDRIGHVPQGETLTARLGQAFDVVASRVQTDFRAVSSGRHDREAAFAIEIRNRKAEPAAVRLREPVPGDWKILDSSVEATKIDAHTLGFELTVAAGETIEVTYRVAIDQG